MTISAGSNYYIDISQEKRTGTAWTVRLYKKRFLGNTLISSDWFLGETQARRFAEQLAADLRDGISLENIKNRKPGWTLHRAAH